MGMRRLLEKDVLIRLTDSGFVETTHYLGLWERTMAWDLAESELPEETANAERLVPVRVRRRHDNFEPGL